MTPDTDRDYPVIDRVDDDDVDDVDDRDDRDPDGTEGDADTEAEYHAAGDGDGSVVEGEVLDAGPAHRADAPVDGVPGESDLAGPGDPLPGEALADDSDDVDREIDLRDDLDESDDAEDYPDELPDVTAAEGNTFGDNPEDAHDDIAETTVVPIDDVAAQDAGVVPVPVTDDAATTADAVDADPVVVPVDTATPAATTSTDTPGESATAAADEAADEDAWRDLQITFVDDPAAAVRDAADLLEKAIADLRSTYEGSESTEDLRTAFRKYRDVYRGLK
jgi:hypothetical protein